MPLLSSSRPQNNRKLKAYKAGILAEVLAVLVLFFKGYRVLCWRFKTGQGEADIIALKGKTLVAVEVKARKDIDSALEAVTFSNRVRVEKAALRYLSLNPRYTGHTLRFDIMAVRLKVGVVPVSFRHLDNAWQGRS